MLAAYPPHPEMSDRTGLSIAIGPCAAVAWSERASPDYFCAVPRRSRLKPAGLLARESDAKVQTIRRGGEREKPRRARGLDDVAGIHE